jgi:ribosomal protein S18 acetylase RimI-like enzyme
MNIRPYQEADEPAVIALWREAFPDEPAHNVPAEVIRRKLAVQRDLFLVAEVGGAVVGTVLAGYDGHRGWLHKVAIAAAHRRRGVGSALVRQVEAALRAVDCPKVNLQVRAANAGVVAFYEALGYRVEPVMSLGKRIDAG